MANEPTPELDHELGTHGDQDIVKGPLAPDDARFVQIGTADDPFEADLIASALEDAAIPVAARAQKDHLMDPLVRPTLPFWTIWVPEADEARGRTLLEARRAELRARAGELSRAAEEEELASEGPPTFPYP